MAKLDFLLDGNHLGEFALEKERMTIGRRPTSDIHIDNLAVSGEHAVIVTIGDDSFLEDLNSTNGTMVNHKTVKKYVLQHNDIVEFGKYQLKYINEKQAQTKPVDTFEKTMIIRPMPSDMDATANVATKPEMMDGAVSHAETIAVALQLTADTAVPASLSATTTNKTSTAEMPKTSASSRLHILNGYSAGRELLLNKAMVTLGKPGMQVAVITKRANGFFLTHVEGGHQPTVNGKSIGMQAHALHDRDVIELAGTKMEFFVA